VDAIFYRLPPGKLFKMANYIGLQTRTWIWNSKQSSWHAGHIIYDDRRWVYPDSYAITENVSIADFRKNLRDSIALISTNPDLKHLILWTYDQDENIPPYHLGMIASEIDLSHLDHERIPLNNILMRMILDVPSYSLLAHSTYFPNTSP